KIDIQQTGGNAVLTLSYQDINRQLEINFGAKFPYEIRSWKETDARGQITIATLKETIKSAYWNKNSNRFEVLRDELGLTK
ncbi:MAG: septum formation inhibitor Maf, partial [Cyanobacteria bacterium P01_F01_bin.42]